MFFQNVTHCLTASAKLFIGAIAFAPLPCYYGEGVGVRGIFNISSPMAVTIPKWQYAAAATAAIKCTSEIEENEEI